MSRSYRSILIVLSFIVMASMLVSCAAPTAAPAAPAAGETAAAPAAAGGKVKIGLSFSDFATER